MAESIPIQNIYYLLCYAWDQLAEGEVVDANKIESNELVDLFASVLNSGIRHIVRKGLDQGYEEHEETIQSIRGKINIGQSIRSFAFQHGRAHCRFDEFTPNTLANQIIKSTLSYIKNVPELNSNLRKESARLYKGLDEINTIRLHPRLFQQVQLHRNNRFYRFLLNICELIVSSMFVDEQSGKTKFRDFIRDEKRMNRLFESFVRNYYRREYPELDVRSEKISWDAVSESDPKLSFLPSMRTDISIHDNDRSLIIDTKYYRETFQSYYGSKTIHSGNLYQILSYLKNFSKAEQSNKKIEGMLLYPVVKENVRETYDIQGHKISICTLNLFQDWTQIKAELGELLLI
jgi:5-methylcytosine-specific restriction enzyme subunit McrC